MITVYLYGFSYMSNFLIGVPVAFLHNMADVTLSWTRMWGETDKQNLAGFSFITATFVWAYTRLYVFP